MTTHRWTSETPRVRANGERIEAGEAFSPTILEFRTWPNRIEKVEDSGLCTVALESGDRKGEICGRELPCRFHSETEADEQVGTNPLAGE